MLSKKSTVLPALAAASLLVFLAACNLQRSSSTRRQQSNSTNTAKSETLTAGREKIGVAECDEFVEKYQACISDHVPPDQQRQFRENIEGYSRAWRQQIASNPDVKSALPAACKRHLEQARITMKQFGCDF